MPERMKIPVTRPPYNIHLLLSAALSTGGGVLLCIWLVYRAEFPTPAFIIWLLGCCAITILARHLRKSRQLFEETTQHLHRELADQAGRFALQAAKLTEDNHRKDNALSESTARNGALQAQLHEVEKILQEAGVAICVIDKDYTIRRANLGMAALFGKGPDELVGNQCFHVMRNPLCGTPRCPLHSIMHGEKGRVEEAFEVANQDGDTRTLALTATPFSDEDGCIQGIINTIRIQEVCDSPLQKVLARRAHDLNNTLAAVIGHTELALLHAEAGTLLHDNLSKALTAGQHSQKLVAKFLSADNRMAPKPDLPFLRGQQPITPPPQKRQNVGGSEKILFVDDEEVLVSMTKQFMDELGYQFDGETSSVAALDRFKKSPEYYDLVITDQAMPGLTGIKMAEAMLALRPDLPIILYSGYSENIDKEQAIQIGIKIFLIKPVAASMLAQTIRSLLDATQQASR